MSRFERLHRAIVTRILEGPGETAPSVRRTAFTDSSAIAPLQALIDKLRRRAPSIDDRDVLSAREVGFTEDQLFEILVSAAVGQATRQYESALAAMRAATAED